MSSRSAIVIVYVVVFVAFRLLVLRRLRAERADDPDGSRRLRVLVWNAGWVWALGGTVLLLVILAFL